MWLHTIRVVYTSYPFYYILMTFCKAELMLKQGLLMRPV